MAEPVTNCPRCGGCVLCGHADGCPDPGIAISGDPEKSQCAIVTAQQDRAYNLLTQY